MRVASIAWLGLALMAGVGAVHGECPAKISPRLCAYREAVQDSAYLRVRISLDAKVESGYVWEKKLPPETIPPRPLLAYSDSLIIKYDLRQPAHPESAYVRLYGANDPVPGTEYVQNHNASVTKANLEILIGESYVAKVEYFCGWEVRPSLCTEINNRSDSDTLRFGISVGGNLESDSAARKRLLSEYAVRDSSWTTGVCWGTDYFATPVAIMDMADDPAIQEISTPTIVCLVAIPRNAASPSRRQTHSLRRGIPAGRRLDGRALPVPLRLP